VIILNKLLSTLFVGIDVSSKTNSFCALDFSANSLIYKTISNNQPGARILIDSVIKCLKDNNLKFVIFALESTSIYSTHIANMLSTDEQLMPFHPFAYCLNPKTIKNFRKSFVDMDKTDTNDAYVIADFARCNKITSKPWRGPQLLALQRLTRYRLHLAQSLTREKTFTVSNIFIKFSELAILEKDTRPFSSNFGATAKAVLTEFLSLDQIIYSSLDDLVNFIISKSKNRFANPELTAKLIQKAARDSYRLDKVLYEPINVTLASSFNIISALEKERDIIDKSIAKNLKGFSENQVLSLQSIPGVGPVYAAGIIAEIGSIDSFRSHDALAKFAGITWRKNQSGNFNSSNTRMTKTGSKYLRYYLFEATQSVIRHIPEYKLFYQKKCSEVPNHMHKRALALTTRKFIRLIYALLSKNLLYSSSKVGERQ
jgi:transposase